MIVDADEGKLSLGNIGGSNLYFRYNTKSIERKASNIKETDFDLENQCEKYYSGMITNFFGFEPHLRVLYVTFKKYFGYSKKLSGLSKPNFLYGIRSVVSEKSDRRYFCRHRNHQINFWKTRIIF